MRIALRPAPARAMKFRRANPVGHAANCAMPRNQTHTAKETDGIHGANRTENRVLLKQKGPETAEYQQFPGFQPVGRDEAGSSNLPSSAQNPLQSADFGGFCQRSPDFLPGKKAAFLHYRQIESIQANNSARS